MIRGEDSIFMGQGGGGEEIRHSSFTVPGVLLIVGDLTAAMRRQRPISENKKIGFLSDKAGRSGTLVVPRGRGEACHLHQGRTDQLQAASNYPGWIAWTRIASPS